MNPLKHNHLRPCVVQILPGLWRWGQIIHQPNCWEVDVVFHFNDRSWVVTVTQRRIRLIDRNP